MARRVLVLSYYFPPSGGPGVQRVLKFVKYLPSFDWTPVVVSVEEGAYPARDASLGADIPGDTPVHRTSSWDPYHLYARLTGRSDDEAVVQGSLEGREQTWKERIARWVRANIVLPDARVGWVPFAIGQGRRLLAEQSFDAILTTGPPHSTHLAGAALQWMTGTPWMADFRDPWTDINYYQELPHTAAARRIDAALERMVLRRADAVATVSPSWQALLRAKMGTEPRTPIHVIQNGFDTEDVGPADVAVNDEVFTITHVGSLYASRNPTALWRAVQRLREAGDVPDLRIRLVGMVDSNVKDALHDHGLADITELVSYVPHPEAVEHMQHAGLLLLSIESFPADTGMLTGKIYEYLATGRPIVGVGPADGDAARLLEQTDGGRLYGRQDVQGLAKYIRSQYEAWANGEPESGATPDALQPYRRKAETGALAEVLNGLGR